MTLMKLFKPLVFILIIAAGFSVTACDSFLDVNDDPNVISDAPEPLRLSGLLGNFSYQTIANHGTRFPAMWIQQIAFNGTPPTEDNYDINATDISNLWNANYDDAMINAKRLNDLAVANENFAYAAIGKTLWAWTAVYTSNLWGDIPFTEALQAGENIKPVYDSQESVYQAAQAMLDTALMDLDRGSVISPAGDDFLYNGDMDKWRALIYTLKARFHINLSNAPGYDAEEQAQKALNALANGFTSNEDDADFAYYDELGSENPWYQWGVDGKWFDRYRMSEHYVQMLQSMDDPRLPVQARLNSEDEYRGHANGQPPENNALVSEMGEFYAAPEASVTWLSYAEAKFIEAEATLILDGAAAADPIYRDAIRASMDKLGVEPADRDAYVSAQPALSGGDGLEDLITQKYIANFLIVSAYNDWRRTGFPEITIIESPVIDVIPLRFVVPNSELDNNLINLEATGIPLGQEAMSVPVWWDSEG
jgi:hypothetical protein